MPRSAAFFDLDKTVIAKSSTLAFGREFYRGGLVNRRAVLKSSFAQFVYVLQGADEDQLNRMRDYLKALCAGWPVDQVEAIVGETLHELIDPLVYAEAVTLFDSHQAAGRDVVLVSSSGEEVVGPIGTMLGVDHVIATRMIVEDGCYTGDIAFYAYGDNKAVAIRDLAAERGYDLSDCYAYSDSATDAPMLEVVGHPTAVNPDKALRRLAAQHDWPVEVWRRPVRLRSRLTHVPTPPAHHWHTPGQSPSAPSASPGGPPEGPGRGTETGPKSTRTGSDTHHFWVLTRGCTRRTQDDTDHRLRADKFPPRRSVRAT